MARDGAHGRPGRHSAYLTLAVQIGAFVVILGIPDGFLGVLWPSIRVTFSLPLDDLGVLTIASAVLYFAGGLIASQVTARIGAGNAMLASCGVALLGLALWSGAPSWLLLLGAVAVLGLSRGVIDAVVNAEAALDGGVRRLGILHGSWALGGTLGPLLVAAVLVWARDWRVAVVVVAVSVLLLTLFALVDRRGHRPRSASAGPAVWTTASAAAIPASEPSPGGDQAAATGEPGVSRSRAVLRGRVGSRQRLVLTIATFVAYTTAESGPIAWGYTYLVYDRRLSRSLAAVAMAAFWAALTAGRFALAVVDDRVAAPAILEASCLLMIAGTGLFWLLPGSASIVGLPIAGLGAAAVFPLLVALMPARVGGPATGHAVGVSIAGASLAGPIAVAVFGVLAAHFGVRVLGVCLFAATLAMYAMNRLLTFVTAGEAA
jgi:fucose permease